MSRQPIPRSVHGVLDYAYAFLLGASPFLFGFGHVAEARIAAWMVAAAVLAFTLLTRFELGVWRVLPYRVHLLLDAVGNGAMLALPWVLGFADEPAARNTFLAFAIVGFAAVALSRTDEMGTVRVHTVGI